MAGAYAETTFPFRIPAGAMAFTSLPPTMNRFQSLRGRAPDGTRPTWSEEPPGEIQSLRLRPAPSREGERATRNDVVGPLTAEDLESLREPEGPARSSLKTGWWL